MPVVGLPNLLRNIAKVRVNIEKAGEEAMEKSADEIVDMMKRFVRRGTEPIKAPRTKRVHDSIGWTWGDPPPGAMVLGKSKKAGGDGRRVITLYAGGEGTMVGKRKQFNLARLLEFGIYREGDKAAGKVQEFPFFFPAWRVGKQRTRRRIARQMKASMTKGLKQENTPVE